MKKMTVLIFFGVLLAGLASHSFAQPRKGGVLVFGRGADSVTLDPAKSDDLESSKVLVNLYEGLVRYRDDSTEVEPSLAESWENSREDTEWVFRLRRGIRFHDGSPFSADAVVVSFMRQIDPGHPYYGEDFKYAAFTFKYVKKVEALDDHTVRISLEKPFAPFLYNLAMDAARIVSPRALERWGKDFWKHPVGTGPFQFVEWAPKARIVLQRNAHYWGEPPHLETLIFKSTIDNRDRLLELKTGAIDAMDGISAETLVELHRNEALRVVTTPGLNVGYLGMNTEKKPFDQLLVRRAINHAINKQNLVKLLYRGMAIPAKNPIPPTLWGYADEVVDYDHDPRKARELLKEAGWENGFETTLWVMPVPRPYMPDPEKIGQIIKNSLAAVGIHATIVSHDWDAYLAKVSNGEHDMCLLGWVGDNGDPDNFLYVLLDEDNAVKPNSENCAFFRNASLHELLIRAQQVADRSERAELYHKAQHIVHEEAPWVPIAHAEQLVAFHKTIHDVAQHPTGVIRFQQVWKE